MLQMLAATTNKNKVREFQEKKPSLEDIFIAATKRSYDIKG